MLIPVLIVLAGLLALIFLAVVSYAAWMAHRITAVERVSVSSHPSQLDIDWENIEFNSREDEVLLSGWYLPTNRDDRCIILVQGTEHHRDSPDIKALSLGRDLVNRGFSVLMFDFRARGKSGGSRSSEGDREQWDVLGAIDYVTTERGIPVERIGLLGFSLGAGVAILVAAREPRIPAIVSDSGFMDYMYDLQLLYLGPIRLPYWFAVLVAFAGKVFFKADFFNVRPAQVVDEVEQPILFIHGTDDPVVPVQESVALYEISDNPEDRIWIVPDAEHVSVYRKMPEEYVRRVSRFFDRNIPQQT